MSSSVPQQAAAAARTAASAAGAAAPAAGAAATSIFMEQTKSAGSPTKARLRRWKWCIAGASLLLLLAVALSIWLPIFFKQRAPAKTFFQPVAACKLARYPDVCLSTIARVHPKYGPRDMLQDSTRAAMRGVEQMLNLTIKLDGDSTQHSSAKTKATLQDCSELLSSSLEELQASLDEFEGDDNYESSISDIQTWLSAALTYEDTCSDEIKELSEQEQAGMEQLKKASKRAEKLLSNVLALINPLVDAWKSSLGSRRWVSNSKSSSTEAAARGRNLRGPKVDAIVAQDGSGHFSSIQDAVNAAPRMNPRRYVIHIRAGVYKEYVTVRSYHPNLAFIGDGQGRTIISGSRSASQAGITTRSSATVAIEGRGFTARDLTIENTAGAGAQQAVALRVGADRAAFWRCSFHGYQDTLLAHVFRQFYRDCTVTGTVDFVFGNAAAVFQGCRLLARAPLQGQPAVVSAQGRTDPAQTTGFSFHKCFVDAEQAGIAPRVYLGRPWKAYARVVWLSSGMAAVVQPEGWLSWLGSQLGIGSAYFAEYRSWGAGARSSRRVRWARVIRHSKLARSFTPGSFIGAASWLPRSSDTGFDDKL